MKKNKVLLALISLLLAIAFILPTSCSQGRSPASRTEFALDTICTVTLYDWDGDADDILDKAFDICETYEQRLSTSVSASDIYKINHSGGKTVTVDPSTAKLISNALEYSKLSDGIFDITILPVKNMWDFSGESENIPSQSALESALKHVDYTQVSVEGNKVTLPDGMGIDLGSIAKGYIADRISESLKECSVRSAIIDLGGNIYALGSKTDGSNWRVGIQKPFDDNGEQLHTVEICDTSAVTSGVYQRYFQHGGKIYHHILNAKTGMPCDTGLYSVTIISDSSEQCDALSTVCMLLGYDKSVELLKQFDGIQAVFITDKLQVLSFKNS